MLLNVYQIYYEEKQLELLDYQPYFNDDCTVYFENTVIANLISEGKHLDSEYFGVVSHKLRQKVSTVMKERWRNIPNIANHSTNEFSKELFEHILINEKPDCMSFQRHMPHDTVLFSDKFHPGFSTYFRFIMDQIGFEWTPTVFKDVFYCNYFVARSDIYESFVKEMLIPAMKVMNKMPELMGNSGYIPKLPDNLREKFGIPHYPYHPFLCERMFSFYAYIKKLRCLHY